jgi:hypothetical protein
LVLKGVKLGVKDAAEIDPDGGREYSTAWWRKSTSKNIFA